MNKTATDVMIHTKTPLNQDEFGEIFRQVKAIGGVIRFEQARERRNFIMVVYDAAEIRAQAILDKITRLGFNAKLVGI